MPPRLIAYAVSDGNIFLVIYFQPCASFSFRRRPFAIASRCCQMPHFCLLSSQHIQVLERHEIISVASRSLHRRRRRASALDDELKLTCQLSRRHRPS